MEFKLKPADRVEITVLVDNYIDIFVPPATPVDRRLLFDPHREIIAEHGFSCLVRIFSGKEEHTVLLDAGLSRECMAWNARQLGISLQSVEAVVLSHGHFDHTGGLYDFFSGENGKIPFVFHPDALLLRRFSTPNGPVELPRIDAESLKNAGAEMLSRSDPSSLADGYMFVTGEVERTVEFETGMPGMEIKRDDTWMPDLILDDQAIVIHIKGRGLIIISGCAHAGIVNTVEYAKKITGVRSVCAVMGGFHLTGQVFEPRIKPTIDAMKAANPDYIIPMHCTGWKAINSFMASMPEKCILNTVGTTYVF
ncbi:MAG: MBL fold metallo-hydrolase [Methanocorpusculum sp.]|uniref:MBL fold metallo-hydrolase n=1 Tax=Methanocorpusculum sp. TaxID=2058474 RepID=UPI0027231AE7|nr:MBL fold metallo-hydrolase [Methanocorpusculum sp.]MDO9523391.1 MBL fold metallo-hydrolase [Methanocorpusculum sp.]